MRRKKQYVEQIIMVTDEGENTAAVLRRRAAEVPRRAEGRPERLHRAHAARSATTLENAVPRRGHRRRRLPVHRRLLLAAEPGAAADAPVEAGAADGDHGLPAAGAQDPRDFRGVARIR